MVFHQPPMDRRAHPRFGARQGAFAVLTAGFKLGQIEDISLGGLAFCYVPLETAPTRTGHLEIHYVHDHFSLRKIPFQAVSDFSLELGLPFNYVERRRFSLRFGTLTLFQRHQLFHFITRYTQSGRMPQYAAS